MPVVKIYHLDDDFRSIEKSRKLIALRDDLIHVGASTDPVKGLRQIRQFKPEILLLDLDMQPITGWQVLEQIDLQKTRVVIVTVDKEVGMKVMFKGASLFLDKTYRKAEFDVAMDTLIAHILLATAIPPPKDDGHVWFTAGGKKNPVRLYLEDIEAIEADGNDSKVYHTDGQLTIDQGLGEVCKMLPADKFMRISKTHIIALNRFHMQHPNSEIELIRVANSKIKKLKVGEGYAKQFHAYLEQEFPRKNSRIDVTE